MSCAWIGGRSRRFAGGVLLLVALLAASASAEVVSPPSPVDILGRRDLDAPFLDAVPLCVPRELEGIVDGVVEKAVAGQWREAHRALTRWAEQLEEHQAAMTTLEAVFQAREASRRGERLEAEQHLAELFDEESQRPQQICLRLERARLLMLLGRASDAAAQLRRVESGLDPKNPWDRGRLAEMAFLRAEMLYLAGRRFDAHLAYRKIAREDDPRLALAARLRLTDLSFDAGKIEQVSREYESLLPRATAFGASLEGWSLRAAEAALDAGDAMRALRWLERFVAASEDRDVRDTAEIRQADLEARLDDPLAARKRLAALVTRRGDDPIGALAAIRAVDLGVFEGSADAGLDLVSQTIQRQRRGLRRYALGVLMEKLAERDAFDQAVAVATRLAFDGVDAVVVPDYAANLDRLLARLVEDGDESCPRAMRALGGRYGILIERSSSVAPFARLGRCFEELGLPWLAVPVYRTISRRFGAAGAASVALALARASVATGDVSLARHMAEAALVDAPPDAPQWEAILAESDFREGRTASAVKRTRSLADDPRVSMVRSSLMLQMARSLAQSASLEDARFLADRIPDWLAETEDEPPSAERIRLLEAGLLAAHVLRRQSDARPAFALYRAVARSAEPGPLRSSARFWLGLARQSNAEGERAWGNDAGRSLDAPWARVASFEARFESLRDVYAGVLR
jgi:predicted negative regulator of RcsB-dependent stress response